MFLPVILATVRLSERKGWVWPSVLPMVGTFVLGVVSTLFPIPTLVGIKWAALTVFFGFTVARLFPYLKNARTVLDAHLYTAVCIYCCWGCSGI